MPYINTNTLQYPLYEIDIKNDFPNTSFPVPFVPPDGYAEVFNSYPSNYNPITQRVREITPTLVDGQWMQTWEIYNLDNATITANAVAARESLYNDIVTATQVRLDQFAQSRGYDSILSACTYAASQVQKFQTEGQYCVAQRDATWAALIQMLAEVDAGTRPYPSGFSDVEPDLPALVWPN